MRGNITAGPVFRPISRLGHVSPLRLSDEALAGVLKLAAERIGLDPAKYAGHSLRRGFMTAASAAGADLAQIIDIGGNDLHRRGPDLLEPGQPGDRSLIEWDQR